MGCRGYIVFLITVLIPLAYASTAVADLSAADQAEAKAKQNFIQHFTDFTNDKNVMGKMESPDGKIIYGGTKTFFDPDDGVSFKSDLTYHQAPYELPDPAAKKNNKSNDPNAQSQILPAFISPHGFFTSGGGSSALERAGYNAHKKYSKAQSKNQRDGTKKQQGVKFQDAFKITTKKVFKGSSGSGNASTGKPDKDQEKEDDRTERVELRPDVYQNIAKVGADSADTILQAARGQGLENDPKVMGNSTLLYEAAGRATQAWWDTALADLSKRRIFKGISGSDTGERVKLFENKPDCQSWAQSVQSDPGFQKLPAAQKQAQLQAIQQEVKKCQQMAAVKWDAVDPRFQSSSNGSGSSSGSGKETLKNLGPQKEDPYERDERVQLAVLNKAGLDPSSVPSNWQYTNSDKTSKIVLGFDKNGNPNVTKDETVAQQLNDYNTQLDQAIQGFKDVKARAPQLQIDEDQINQFKIQPNTRSVMDINTAPPQAFEEYNINRDKVPDPNPAQTYIQELQQNKRKQ